MKKTVKAAVIWFITLILLTGFYILPYLEMMSQPGEMTSMLMELRKRELKQGQLALLVLGDSVALGQGSQKETEGYAGSIARYFEKQHIHVQYKNRGIAGLTSANLLQLLKENRGWQADIRQADLVLISVGGNDILQPMSQGLSLRETFSLITDIKRRFQTHLAESLQLVKRTNPQAFVLVNSLYNPLSPDMDAHDAAQLLMKNWNREMEGIVARYQGVEVVRLDDMVSTHRLADQIHPNDEGYRYIANCVVAVLQEKTLLLG